MHVSPAHWHLATLGGITIHKGTNFYLDSVSCPLPSFCLIAGDTDTYSIVEHFNGSTWSRVLVGRKSDTFDSVSCASATFCMVVGQNARSDPLAEIYDGRQWNRVLLAGSNTTLTAVDCTTVGKCIVIGEPYGTTSSFSSWVFASDTWRRVKVHPGISALIGIGSISCVTQRTAKPLAVMATAGPATPA